MRRSGLSWERLHLPAPVESEAARAVLVAMATMSGQPRLVLEAHGTGSTLASAIAARRAQGMPMKEACLAASDYVHAALRGGYRPGRSDILVLDHVGAAPRA